jgi:hypothetical protein
MTQPHLNLKKTRAQKANRQRAERASAGGMIAVQPSRRDENCSSRIHGFRRSALNCPDIFEVCQSTHVGIPGLSVIPAQRPRPGRSGLDQKRRQEAAWGLGQAVASFLGFELSRRLADDP